MGGGVASAGGVLPAFLPAARLPCTPSSFSWPRDATGDDGKAVHLAKGRACRRVLLADGYTLSSSNFGKIMPEGFGKMLDAIAAFGFATTTARFARSRGI